MINGVLIQIDNKGKLEMVIAGFVIILAGIFLGNDELREIATLLGLGIVFIIILGLVGAI